MRTLTLGMAAALGLCLIALGGLSAADDPKTDLKVGDKAPAFQAKDDQGKDWKSSDHIGKNLIVVYFYPADMTGGCTKQACGFRDDMKKLTDKGVEVVGVSGDSVKNHQFFKKEKNLDFTLLADEQGAVAKKFGVPTSTGGDAKVKDSAGNDVVLTRGITIKRWTFVIGKDGNIVYKDTEVKADQDSKKILETVEKLGKK